MSQISPMAMFFQPRFSAMFRPLFALLCLCGVHPLVQAQVPLRAQIQLNILPEPYSIYEQNIRSTLYIDVSSGGPPPMGTVTFFVNDVQVCNTQQVTNNMAECDLNTPTYPVGTYKFSAVYSGDANYLGASDERSHQITALRSETTLSLGTTTFYYGQLLLEDALATVTPIDSAPDATLNGGTISFPLDGTEICVLPITGNRESCPKTAGQGTDAGSHVIEAIYSGNQYYEGSHSLEQSFTVLPDSTTASLKTSLTPSLYGQNVTFTATLNAPYATPVGPVAFYDGVTLIGTGSLDASGVATVSTSTLTVGTHSIVAKYAATLDFNASNSTPIQQVVVLPPPAPVGTATFVTSSLDPSVLGQNVTFTASVATTGAFVQIPSGTITFLDGNSVLGTATLDATGSAQYSTSALAIGQHQITVSYAGTSIFAASTSAVLLQQVVSSLTSAGNGFLLTVTPTTFGVGVGNYVSVSVDVLPLNGFNEPVQLSCTSAPAEMRCLFDSVLIPAGGGTTRLTVNPAAPHDCGSDTPYFMSSAKGELFPLLAGSFAFLLRRRRKGWSCILALVSLLAVLPMLGGCGHCTDLGVKPGNYTFSVQGASIGTAAVAHAVGMSMTVHL